MHIIIPMSGVGQRFIDAGYKDPKPLVIIDGKPIIEHVCDLFSGEEKFTFICNSTHLKTTKIRDILLSLKPSANIIEIPNHKKGPVYAVDCISHLIKDNEEVIVNYCDFGTYWNYQDFLKHSRNRMAAGAIPSYKGFHPHMLGSTNYAFIRDENQWMLEIKEKEPFTDNRMQEYASNGTYYFQKGEYVKKYFSQLIEQDINLNGEYYVSLVYNLMKQDGLDISVYEIQHMLQWGTPEDVDEYNSWSRYFYDVSTRKDENEILKNTLSLIPLAGRGSRFSQGGYLLPKPLLPISGKPMILQAAQSLPKTDTFTFVTLEEHMQQYDIGSYLISEYPSAKIITIDEVTLGQAITCNHGLEYTNSDNGLIIAATDNGMLYQQDKFTNYLDEVDTDAVIFTFRGNIGAQMYPSMYGWVETNNNIAIKVSVKKPISNNPKNDHAIVGTFWFRKIEYFKSGLEQLLLKNVRVNGEYYVDSIMQELIELGYTVKVLEVDHYICWGTPNDYKTFNYWQSYFHKDINHPYDLRKDSTVNLKKIPELEMAFFDHSQEYE